MSIINIAACVSSVHAKLYLDLGITVGRKSKKSVRDEFAVKFRNGRPLIYGLSEGRVCVLTLKKIVPNKGEKPYAAVLGHWQVGGDDETVKRLIESGAFATAITVSSCPALVFARDEKSAEAKAFKMCDEVWPHAGAVSGNSVKVKLIPEELYG